MVVGAGGGGGCHTQGVEASGKAMTGGEARGGEGWGCGWGRAQRAARDGKGASAQSPGGTAYARRSRGQVTRAAVSKARPAASLSLSIK